MQANLKIINKAPLTLYSKSKSKIIEINIGKFEEMLNIEKEKIVHYSSIINLDECINDKEFVIYDKTIRYTKQNIIDETLYPNYENQKEKYNNPKRKIIISFLNNQNNEISEEYKNELINIIKDSNFHNIFISLLNRLRTISQRPKAWVELFGECLNILLDKSKKENDYDYDMIKNCIILSQTYFYVENNEKNFIISKLKKKEYFNDLNFRKNYINIMIIKQLKSYKETNSLLFGKEFRTFITGEGMTNKLKNKFDDFLFVQFLHRIDDMIDFNLKKENIINVLNYFNER